MRILCATDLMPDSEPAIDRAGILAQILDADLSLLHVVEPPESERLLGQNVSQATERLKSRSQVPLWLYGPTPSILVRAGNRVRIVVQTANDIDADLIVMGVGRKRPVHDAIVGTLAQRVLSECRRPVLVVQQRVRGGYRNTLLALDMSPSAAAIVAAAEELVTGDDTCTSIVHVYRPSRDGMLTSVGVAGEANARYSQAEARKGRTAIRKMLKRTSKNFARYQVILDSGRADTSIQKVAERIDPDLLIVGTRGHGVIRRALLGSVAGRVLAGAHWDVLVIPETEQVAFEIRGGLAPTREYRDVWSVVVCSARTGHRFCRCRGRSFLRCSPYSPSSGCSDDPKMLELVVGRAAPNLGGFEVGLKLLEVLSGMRLDQL